VLLGAGRLALGAERPHPECGSRISEITPSSSSSQVWKLGIEALRAGQPPDRPVGRLWAVTVVLLSTRGHLDGCSPSPRGVHPLSPVSPGRIPRSCPGAGTVGRRHAAESAMRRHTRRSRRCPEPEDAGAGRPPAAGPVTGGDPAGTRSPQPVHIPGDNFSMCRRRSPAGHRQLPPSTRASRVSTSVHGCGQPLGQTAE